MRRNPWNRMAPAVLTVLLGVLAYLAIAFPPSTDPRASASTPHHPPQMHWLERILYHPAGARIVVADGADATLEGDLFALELDNPDRQDGTTAEGAAEASSGTTLSLRTLRRHVPFSAVVGRRYAVDLPGGGQGRWQLIQGPPEMTLDTDVGQLRWMPTAATPSRWEVVLQYVGEGGLSETFRYPLHVAPATHLLGTDERGRDVLTMIAGATRWVFFPGVLAVLVALSGGLVVGALAGFKSDLLGRSAQLFLQAVESVPGLLILLILAVASDFNMTVVMIGVGLVFLPSVASAVSTTVKGFREMDFVEAGRELGLTDREILWREIIWFNARPTLIGFAFYALALAVLMEVTLSYLRVGIQPPEWSWGTILMQGRSRLLLGEFWLTIPTSLAIISVLGLLAATGRTAQQWARAAAFGEQS